MNITQVSNGMNVVRPNQTPPNQQTTQPARVVQPDEQQQERDRTEINPETQRLTDNLRQIQMQPQTQPGQPEPAENQAVPGETQPSAEANPAAPQREPAAPASEPREQAQGAEPAPPPPEQPQQQANAAQARQQYQTNPINPNESPLINLFG